MTNKVRVKNPNAIVFIYNYADRLGTTDIGGKETNIDQIILNTVSLKAVSTQKSKSNPAGAFEFRLAPTKNWVTAITPGSWCIILMSNEKLDDKAKYGGGRVDEKSFKMLGRIESVRGVINTNQTTGAKETEYIVTGSDWGTIFNSNFYVDPLNRAPSENAVGMAERFGYDKYLLDAAGGFDVSKLGKGAKTTPNYVTKTSSNDKVKASRDRLSDIILNGSQGKVTAPLAPINITQGSETEDAETGLPTSRDNVNFLLSLWGRSDAVTSAIEGQSGLVAKSKQRFSIPNEVAKYMGFVDKTSRNSPLIAQIIQQISGVLTSSDMYSNSDPSAGIIDFNSVLGEHSMWQLLMNNSNQIMNELINEIRFENGLPKLTVYNRIRPFAINKESNILRDSKKVGDNIRAGQEATVKDFISQYKNVKKIKINGDDVIMSSYGTNWRDRVNFIEVNIAKSLFSEAYSAEIKLESQFYDEKSISRDGLLSMMKTTQYVPLKDRKLDPRGVFAYKTLLKEWYFDTHKMFNGTLSLIGQDQYIQVGDNILVESRVLNMDNFNNNSAQKNTTTKTYMLAHVESISHQTNVDNNGGRVFTTNINFVRGIITDVNGNMIVADGVGAVDQDGSLTSPSLERNKASLSTSGTIDPDRQKLKGN